MLVKLSFILAARSLILLVFEKKALRGKIIDGFFFCLFTAFFALFFTLTFDYSDLILLPITAYIGVTLYYRINKPSEQKPIMIVSKGAGLVIFLILMSFSLIMRFNDDQPVIKVSMTGNSKKEWIEWKNPKGSLHKAYLKAYEVHIETPEGKNLISTHLFGEVVGVRAKVIRFHPILNLLGMNNLCQIDALYNGYLIPNSEIPLYATGIENKVWSFWEFLFFGKVNNFLIKCATLESNYFPLVDKKGKAIEGSYFLTINSNGLSSIIIK